MYSHHHTVYKDKCEYAGLSALRERREEKGAKLWKGNWQLIKKSGISYMMSPMTFLIVMSFLILTGCATMEGADFVKPMTLNDDTNALDLKKKSVALLTVKTSNQYKPGYQPDMWGIYVLTNDGKEKKEIYRFGDKLGRLTPYKADKEFNEYLVGISLAAGKYKLGRINGTGGVFPIRGGFAIPVFADFDLPPNKIVYLGRIEATLRERKKDDELRAGPVLPLLDQAATGFYSGTFYINVYDNYDKDVSLFKQKYPLLNNFTIEKAVLPPWRKPTAEEMKN
jgi:hypothetical protein